MPEVFKTLLSLEEIWNSHSVKGKQIVLPSFSSPILYKLSNQQYIICPWCEFKKRTIAGPKENSSIRISENSPMYFCSLTKQGTAFNLQLCGQSLFPWLMSANSMDCWAKCYFSMEVSCSKRLWKKYHQLRDWNCYVVNQRSY